MTPTEFETVHPNGRAPRAPVIDGADAPVGHAFRQRGRRVALIVKALQTDRDDAGFPHATHLVQVQRTHTTYPGGGNGPKKAVEAVYLVCPLNHLAAPVQ